MRKLMLFLALIGASVLFLGAAPGTASAANCSATFSPGGPQPNFVWYDSGYLWFNPYLYNCSGISEVMIAAAPVDTFNGFWTGLHDQANGTLHMPPRPPFGDTYTFIAGSKTWFSLQLGVNPWCPPQTTHAVVPRFSFKIKSSSPPYQYGPWHSQYLGFSVNIWC